MAVLNQQQKWIYLMEPHTASRAVTDALLDQIKCGEHGHHHIGIPEIMDKRRTPTLHSIQEWDVICTVRNPFDVLITQWKATVYSFKHDKKRYVPFLDWVMNNIEKSHDVVCTPLRGLWKETTSVCYYEHLEEDLHITFNKYIKLGRDPSHKTPGKRHWSEYWAGGREVMQRLLPHYNQFLDHYGYEVWWVDNDTPTVSVNQDIRELRCRKIALR